MLHGTLYFTYAAAGFKPIRKITTKGVRRTTVKWNSKNDRPPGLPGRIWTDGVPGTNHGRKSNIDYGKRATTVVVAKNLGDKPGGTLRENSRGKSSGRQRMKAVERGQGATNSEPETFFQNTSTTDVMRRRLLKWTGLSCKFYESDRAGMEQEPFKDGLRRRTRRQDIMEKRYMDLSGEHLNRTENGMGWKRLENWSWEA